MKKVVIRVPCFNHEKYVGLCLESIAAQDYPALDVIVVDDASTDGTAAVAEACCRRFGFASSVTSVTSACLRRLIR